MALLIRPQGQTQYVEGTGPHRKMTLQQLQEAVGGFIEVLPLTDGRWLVVNEEGKLRGLPPNPHATSLYRERHPTSADTIVGAVVVCSGKELD